MVRRSRLAIFPCVLGLAFPTFAAAQEPSAPCCVQPAACADGCGCAEGLFTKDWLADTFVYRSERCFQSFTAPATNPVLWEDPRTMTKVRFLFIDQDIPLSSPLNGGDFQVVAAQVRVALSERLSFIATKDGYIDLNSGVGAVNADGWANLAAGLKYNLIRDVESQTLLSGGFVYEIPSGRNAVFQGLGGGDFHLFLSGATELTDRSNWLAGSGFRIPADGGEGTQLWYLSNHIDYEIVPDSVFALLEVNWYHWLNSSNGPLTGIEGGDLLNLGSQDVAGNDIVTMAVGTAFNLSDNLEVTCAWEFPLTQRRDLLEDRLTLAVLLNY